MILRAKRIHFSLRDWLDELLVRDLTIENLYLSNLDWKKLEYLIILLRLFADYISFIGNTRDATINHTWNVYNALFDYLDVIRDKFDHKDLEKTPWISEFITAVDIDIQKLKEYYSKTGEPVETQ